MNFFGTKDIKFYVNQFIEKNQKRFKGKAVLDVPAGNGVTAKTLAKAGANVLAMDLFPEFFNAEGIICKFCNLEKSIGLANESVDAIFCQEGIEHLSNQFKVFGEFNRVLKHGGSLFITTPNYSNLKSKLSYLLTESEYFNKIMPPNEVDDLWFSRSGRDAYYGHLFLIGIQKLRTFASLNGFRIKQLMWGKINGTSLLLLILLYPLIYFSAWRTKQKNLNKKKNHPQYREIKKTYDEIFALNINLGALICNHLFIEFEKIKNPEEVDFSGFSKYHTKDFAT